MKSKCKGSKQIPLFPNGAATMKGAPEYLRSDSGPEFVAKDLHKWLVNGGKDIVHRTRISM
jgi:hypothetical protein